MPENFYKMMPGAVDAQSDLEYLNQSSFDELAEFDIPKDRYHSIYHVEGKYFLPLTDCSVRDFFQYAMDHMIHPDDRMAFYAFLDPDTLPARLKESETPGLIQQELRCKLLDGSWRWTKQLAAGGAEYGLSEGTARVYIYDIQNQKNRQLGLNGSFSSGIEPSRKWDELTGLLREKSFFAACGEILPRNVPWTMVCIDIENFKLFNDWYGREAGDILLARVGARLKHVAEVSGGLAGYMGQDDFCLLLPQDRKKLDQLYEDLHQLIVERGTSVGFLPAFGVGLSDGSISVLDLYDRAALAARFVKGDFHNRVRFYEPSMHKQTEEEYRILSDFQKGLASHEVFFCLQPQCRVSTGNIVGAESLARWRRADGTMVPPDRFVPVLEKYGFVTDLDRYIWEEVCVWLHGWIAGGHTPLPISVNVSQVDIFTMDVPEFMDYLTRKYDLPKSVLKIEITESAYVSDTTEVKEAVQKLRELGFLVLMDDFGSGYSSLNMLRKLNVDIIKLDAQFLRLSDRDEEKGVQILETIVNMAKTMSLPIIVEGVESEEQVSFLADLGCSYIQGYHFYRPMEVAEFEKLIGDERNIDTQGFLFRADQQFQIREFMDQNIYSDTMLNNILGAMAFYRWDGGENVDIVRFNEQFFHIVGEEIRDFHARIEHIQNYLHPHDRAPFLEALRRAEHDRLNGASGLFGTYRKDGTLVRLLIHFYFLELTDAGKVFYGAVQDVTEITNLQNQMRLLSRFSSESIVFLHRKQKSWRYEVVVHGLRKSMGLSHEEFQRELNDGTFFNRVSGEVRKRAHSMLSDEWETAAKRGFTFALTNARNETIHLSVKTDYVHDDYSSVDYILSLRPQVPPD